MADPVTIFWQCVLALSYVFLVIQKRNGLWLFWAGVFALTAVYIRYSIDVDAVRDFDPYFASFLQVKYEGLSITSVFEPYRVALFKTVLLSGDLDDHTQIGLVYYFHFAVVTSFFIWLAYYKDVTFEAKLILFLAFYPTKAFPAAFSALEQNAPVLSALICKLQGIFDLLAQESGAQHS